MLWMSSNWPFIFWTRKLRIRDVKELAWKHSVRSLSYELTLWSSPFLLRKICWLKSVCKVPTPAWAHSLFQAPLPCSNFSIRAAKASTPLPYYLGKEQGLLFHCSQCGGILWKCTYGRLLPVAKTLPYKPLGLEEWLPNGSPIIHSMGPEFSKWL